ncbi:hypothetical protein WJX81_003780 [Elliptochloris bilobata]|uniref:SNF2 super family n=1 Tax=Elliptochloris bilobata TaxID=381761 RepID=A0AAW1RYL0_9CHLO
MSGTERKLGPANLRTTLSLSRALGPETGGAAGGRMQRLEGLSSSGAGPFSAFRFMGADRAAPEEPGSAQHAHANGARGVAEAGRSAKRARMPPPVRAPPGNPAPSLDTCGSSPELGALARPAKRRMIIDDSEDDATPARRAGAGPVRAVGGLAASDDGGDGGVAACTTPRTGNAGQAAGAPPQGVVDLTLSSGGRSPLRVSDPNPAVPRQPATLVDTSPDAVLRRCERIAADLRSTLGMQEDARYAAVESGGVVSREALVAACGEAVADFKGYQLVGVNFLMLLARAGVGGAILADEMGLGKTAQAIAFLGALRLLDGDAGPHIIVAPASLLENWQRELALWCPSLKVAPYFGAERIDLRNELDDWRHRYRRDGADAEAGSSREGAESGPEEEDVHDADFRAGAGAADNGGATSPAGSEASGSQGGGDGDVWTEAVTGAGQDAAPFNVLLTCYTLFERDSAEQKLDRQFLKRWRWSHMVLDEAHAVKNRSAARTVRLNRIAAVCRRRLMLTGTPLQNDLEELQNLLAFLLPDVFHADVTAQLADEQDERSMEALAKRMKALLGPFVLRRLKSEVASQLVLKQQRVEQLEMTEVQATLYAEALQSLRSAACSSGLQPSGSEADAAAAAAKIMRKLGKAKAANMFAHMRKIAQHPLLVRRVFSDKQVVAIAKLAYARGLFGEQCSFEQVRKELAEYSDFGLHSFSAAHGKAFVKYLLPVERVQDAAKCRFLARLLPELKAKGSRPLIFSQWTSTLDILEWLLQQLGLPFLRLDGSTAVAERLSLVDQFNDSDKGVFAMLLSTRAGGQGLNLTGADTVVLHDVDFNPAIDRQAEDRCHRLGQTKAVTVHRLVTKGTVDEGIFAMATRKTRLDAAVLDGITASGDGRKAGAAAETLQMGELLQHLLEGNPAEDGQLGVDADQSVMAPKVVEALLGTRFRGREFLRAPLVAGSRNTLAIDSEGQVLSWGWNARGTLGHGHRGNERKPRRLAALSGVTISQVAIGGWHCLALDAGALAAMSLPKYVVACGLVYAWGGNEYGQCGVHWGARDVVEPAPCVPSLRVVQVAAGGMHSCVLTTQGEVWTWGEPWGDFSMQVDRTPRKVPGAVNVAKIVCGAFHNLALNKQGEVLAWGINDFGQLGNGSTFYETSPTQVVGLEGVQTADVEAGGWHSLAITTDGEVFVWGRGEYGRLGLGDRSGSSRLRATLVKAMEGHSVVQGSCGGTHTLVLTAEGRIFTWGRGSFGRLGTGVEKDCYSPVEVFLPGGPERWRVICITAGGRHSMALALPDNGDADGRMLSRRATALGGAVRRAVLALGDSETTDEVLGASEPEVGLDLDDGRDHEEDMDALNDILANQEEHALGGLIDRSSSRALAEDASSTGSGGAAAEATPPHLHLPHWAQALAMVLSRQARRHLHVIFLGFRLEHFRLALQMAVAIAASLPFVYVDRLYTALGSTTFWVVVTVVVALAPNVGSALKRSWQGATGTVLGCALGVAVMSAVGAVVGSGNFTMHPVKTAVWGSVFLSLGGGLLMLQKARFPKLRYACDVALLTYVVVSVPGLRSDDDNTLETVKLAANACIGVGIALVVAGTCAPVRAREALRRCTARLLEQLGDFAFFMLGEFCQEPDAEGRIPGCSGTDASRQCLDDGLAAKYEDALAEGLRLHAEQARVAALLAPARAEWAMPCCGRPDIPVAAYKRVSRAALRALTQMVALVHTLEDGTLRLRLCHQKHSLLEDLRQDVAAAFTALAGIVSGHGSEAYAEAKMGALGGALAALQAATQAEPLGSGYDMAVETLALACYAASQLARQVTIMYGELRPEAGARVHAHVSAISGVPASDADKPDPPAPRSQGPGTRPGTSFDSV